MTIRNRLLLAAGAAVILQSCSLETATITGTIVSHGDMPLKDIVLNVLLEQPDNTQNLRIKLDENGHFALRVPHSLPIRLRLLFESFPDGFDLNSTPMRDIEPFLSIQDETVEIQRSELTDTYSLGKIYLFDHIEVLSPDGEVFTTSNDVLLQWTEPIPPPLADFYSVTLTLTQDGKIVPTTRLEVFNIRINRVLLSDLEAADVISGRSIDPERLSDIGVYRLNANELIPGEYRIRVKAWHVQGTEIVKVGSSRSLNPSDFYLVEDD